MCICIHVASGTGGMSRRHMPRGYIYTSIAIEQTTRECSHPPSIKPNLSQILPSSCLLRSAEKHRLLCPRSVSLSAHFEPPRVDVRCQGAPVDVHGLKSVRTVRISTTTTRRASMTGQSANVATRSAEKMPRTSPSEANRPNPAPAAHRGRANSCGKSGESGQTATR